MLKEFDFELKSIKGEHNNIDDGLSRLYSMKEDVVEEKFTNLIKQCTDKTLYEECEKRFIDGKAIGKVVVLKDKSDEFIRFIHGIEAIRE